VYCFRVAFVIFATLSLLKQLAKRDVFRGQDQGAPIDVQQKLMRHINVSAMMSLYSNASIKAKQ
jgi:hypothetical protein